MGKGRHWQCVWIVAWVAVLVCIGAISSLHYIGRLVCIDNLRAIYGAKENWALAHAKPNGVVITPEQLKLFMPGGYLPKCPLGGEYDIGLIGQNPTCLHKDRFWPHELPSR